MNTPRGFRFGGLFILLASQGTFTPWQSRQILYFQASLIVLEGCSNGEAKKPYQ